MFGNLPVPDGSRAPVNILWLWYIGPPAAIVAAYRLIPTSIRAQWNPHSTSHLAMASILNGGGWRSFKYYTTRVDDDWPGGNPA